MRNHIIIRRGHSDDTPHILSVRHAAIRAIDSTFYDLFTLKDWSPEPTPPDRIKELAAGIASGEEILLVAQNPKDQIVGFGSIVPSHVKLGMLYVHPDYARQGLGGRILDELEELAKKAGLPELKMDSSLNAEQFYQSHGYEILERTEYISRSGHRAPCLKMRKHLL